MRNELLCYAFTHAHNSTLLSLAACLCEFYNPEEVVTAREILWNECHKFLGTDVKKPRRSQLPFDRQSARPFIDDTCYWVGLLVNNQRCLNMDVLFCAVDLQRTPPCPPEAINLFSLAARVDALEKRGAQHPEHHASASRVPPQTNVAHQYNADNTSLKTVFHVNNAQASAAGPLASAAADIIGDDDDDANPNPWTEPGKRLRLRRAKERKQMREAAKELKTVVGTGNDSSEIQSCRATKQLFVHRLERCTTESIKKYMLKKGVTPRDVHRTSKEDWLNASFKLTVLKTDVEKIFDACFWPDGVRCREWLPRIPKVPTPDAAPIDEPPKDSKNGEEDRSDDSDDDIEEEDAEENAADAAADQSENDTHHGGK